MKDTETLVVKDIGEEFKGDPAAKMIANDIMARQQLGIAKYGMTMANNPLSFYEWLQHAYEEQLDNLVYLKRAMQQMRADETDNIVKSQLRRNINRVIDAYDSHVSLRCI